MGSYVSREGCLSHHGVRIDCTPPNATNRDTVSGFQRGQFPSDADIAGVGVLGAYLAVTVFSIILAIFSTIWWWSKNVSRCKAQKEDHEKEDDISVSGFVEILIISCSDQQVFTGGAYAITLRYVKGCEITAYHYNIVSNMLLISCATHLMAVAVTRNYWESRYMSLLRVAITALLYVTTGLLLSNQGAGSVGFPSAIPPTDRDYDNILMMAACFQSGSSNLASAAQDAIVTGGGGALFISQIPGWGQYIVMVLFYIVAVLIRFGRLIRNGARDNRDGRRAKLVAGVEKMFPPLFTKGTWPYWLRHFVYGVYLLAGIVIACWTVATSGMYVAGLRDWVNRSGWIGDFNPEMDPYSFGQLIPLLLMALTFFTFFQALADQFRSRRAKRDHRTICTARKSSDMLSTSNTATITQQPSVGLSTLAMTPSSPVEKKDELCVTTEPASPYKDLEAGLGEKSNTQPPAKMVTTVTESPSSGSAPLDSTGSSKQPKPQDDAKSQPQPRPSSPSPPSPGSALPASQDQGSPVSNTGQEKEEEKEN